MMTKVATTERKREPTCGSLRPGLDGVTNSSLTPAPDRLGYETPVTLPRGQASPFLGENDGLFDLSPDEYRGLAPSIGWHLHAVALTVAGEHELANQAEAEGDRLAGAFWERQSVWEPPPPATPALNAWKDRGAAQKNPGGGFDDLWRAACWEQAALEAHAQGAPPERVHRLLERSRQLLLGKAS